MKPKSNYKVNKLKFNTIDFCETPYYALYPLLEFIENYNIVWEPATGNGNITNELRKVSHTVIDTDIQSGTNFFNYEPANYDIQITNPPFGIKYDWLLRSYELNKPFALLLPTETIGAAKAQVLFARFGVQIIYISKRIDFKMPNKGWNGTGAQFSTAWFTYKLNLPKDMVFFNLDKPNKTDIIKYYEI